MTLEAGDGPAEVSVNCSVARTDRSVCLGS